jgi:hypothetical protein
MYFVPEGEHDRSQARSAWGHEENSPVPAGRCDRSLAQSAWNSANLKSRPVGYGMIRAGKRIDSTWRPFPREIPLGLAAPDHTVPYGNGTFEGHFPRHFVPGYDQPVPPGQKNRISPAEEP